MKSAGAEVFLTLASLKSAQDKGHRDRWLRSNGLRSALCKVLMNSKSSNWTLKASPARCRMLGTAYSSMCDTWSSAAGVPLGAAGDGSLYAPEHVKVHAVGEVCEAHFIVACCRVALLLQSPCSRSHGKPWCSAPGPLEARVMAAWNLSSL